MKHLSLIPNKSLGMFVLGRNIKEYKDISHYTIHHEDKSYSYDSYEFDKQGVTLWLNEDNNIDTILCEKECYWRGKNLIKMPIDNFLLEYNIIPDKIEKIYVLINENRGQNQMAYDFNKLGLIIWTWRKRIKTISISDYSSIRG